jgi:hypothetical protein
VIKRLVGGLALAVAACGATISSGMVSAAHATGNDDFYWLLSQDFDDEGVNGEAVVARHAGRLRDHGLLACQLLDNGWDSLDVTDQLMMEGPYFSDLASNIKTAAMVVYCPHHLSPGVVS